MDNERLDRIEAAIKQLTTLYAYNEASDNCKAIGNWQQFEPHVQMIEAMIDRILHPSKYT